MKNLLLFTVCLSVCVVSLATAAKTVSLETPQGTLIGQAVGKHHKIQTYKGIPYALPPVGDRRWRPAEPAPNWVGERLATQFAPSCVQLPYDENSFFYRPNYPTSEDCLYLNVWSPLDADKPLPVMVWIYGGALTRGSSSIDTYDGTALAKKGVVVVTINYRLGIFGHFAHPDLSAESEHGVSGNYATTDQLQALHWVQKNIAAFGGDPKNVTIFGESAGSWSVTQLVATPLAKGLFHHAIGESGTVLGVMPTLKTARNGRPSAEDNGKGFQEAVGAKSLADLRAMSADKLLNASIQQRTQAAAIVDGWVFPDQIYNLFSKGLQNQVPVMVGFNADEGTTLGVLNRVPKDPATYEQNMRRRYGELADDYLARYPASNLRQSTLDSFRDNFVTWSMQTWAMMTANVKQPAYLYYFSHRPSGPQRDELGAYHAAEIKYVFDNYRGSTRADKKLADIMSDYWVAFAKNGNPNTKGRPQWQPYTADARYFMEFNGAIGKGAIPGKDVLQGTWELQEKLMARSRR